MAQCVEKIAEKSVEKIELRAVIRFLHLKGNNAKSIHAELVAVYGDSAPAYDTVVKWRRRFQCGQTSLEDDARSGRPSLSEEAGIAEQVEALVLADRRITVEGIVQTVHISHGSVCNILHNDLNMTKVAARWVPRLLTPMQKERRKESAMEMLQQCQTDPDNFFDRLVTMDECWVYHYDPETKEQSKQWKHISSPPPKKAKMQPSSGKVMLSVFWDCNGLLLTDYARKGQTITGNYYRDLLTRLRDTIKAKRRGKLTKGVRLLHDNAPAHSAQATVTHAADLGYEILPHPPYSPDLAPSDFFLFPRMKSPMRGRRFQDDDEVIAEVEHFLNTQSEDFYNQGLRQLIHRWEKCVALCGSYVEKD